MNYKVRCIDCGNESEEFEYEVLPEFTIQLVREYIICLVCESKNKEIIEA